MNDENSKADAERPVERDVIHRCGWCGYPVAEDGSLLSAIQSTDDANEYLMHHEGAEEVLVNGACCPYGNYTPDEYNDILGV